MINAVGAVARRMPSAARRSGCWTAWCQAVLFGASALVIVAERTARKWAVRIQTFSQAWVFVWLSGYANKGGVMFYFCVVFFVVAGFNE